MGMYYCRECSYDCQGPPDKRGFSKTIGCCNIGNRCVHGKTTPPESIRKVKLDKLDDKPHIQKKQVCFNNDCLDSKEKMFISGFSLLSCNEVYVHFTSLHIKRVYTNWSGFCNISGHRQTTLGVPITLADPYGLVEGNFSGFAKKWLFWFKMTFWGPLGHLDILPVQWNFTGLNGKLLSLKYSSLNWILSRPFELPYITYTEYFPMPSS